MCFVLFFFCLNYNFSFPNVIGLSGSKEIAFWLEWQIGGGESMGAGHAAGDAASQGLLSQLQAKSKVSLSDRIWVRADTGWKENGREEKNQPLPLGSS